MKLCSLSVIGLVLVCVSEAALNSRAGPDAQKDADDARHALRQQGFKTDLSDFDFSADYETAGRPEAVPTGTGEKACEFRTAVDAYERPSVWDNDFAI